METRKKRATELIEKCDMKIFSVAERTQIVQIYDRRVKVELSESLLEKTSLYAVVRSWIQDDPDKPQMDVVRCRKLRRVETKVDSSSPVMKKLEDKRRESILTSDSQPEDFKRQLSAHIRHFKRIRHRSVVNFATRYARSVESLDEMKIPRLSNMVKILQDHEQRSQHHRNQQNNSASADPKINSASRHDVIQEINNLAPCNPM